MTTLTSSVRRAIRSAARTMSPSIEVPPGAVSVSGSIVASQNGVPDCSAKVSDGGYNLSSDAADSCGFTAPSGGGTDLITTDPSLKALSAVSGELTKTRVPNTGSPAIDVIPLGQAGCVVGAKDQRGVARPQPTGGKCDIGAVEVQYVAPPSSSAAPPPPPVTCPPLTIDTDSLPDGTVGVPYSVQLQASGGCDSDYDWTVPSQQPEGGFPSPGAQTTVAAAKKRQHHADAAPALGFTPPIVTGPTVTAPAGSTSSGSTSSDSAGNTAPPGLSVSADGVLSGTPTQAGDFTFTVSVDDPVLKTLVLHVVAPAATSSSAAPSTSHAVAGASTSAAPTSASTVPLANTGTPVGTQLRLAWWLLAAGAALLAAGMGGRRIRPARRH